MESPEKARALEEVFESIKVIDSSLRCYYAGEQHMYRAMAGQLRILFCDTTARGKKPNSLLGRAFSTCELPRIRRLTWLPPGSPEQHDPRLRHLRAGGLPAGWVAQFARMPFVVTEYGNGLVVADIELEDDGPLLPVDRWSAQWVTTHPARITIRRVIRDVADKGGGAHIDLIDSPELALMRRAQPAGGVGQHILFTVALSRFALNLGVYLAQLRDCGGLNGQLPQFQPDATHPSAVRMARVPSEAKATGGSEYHLCMVRVLPPSAGPLLR